MKNFAHIILLFLVFVLASCNTTEKILKSSDNNLKYTKAIEWYNKGQYFKAIPVFEELMGLYKGEKSTEEIYYYYCMAQFKQKSYLLAAYHFKNYTTKHPFSKFTEEALYMHAESYNKQTLDYSLDQTETVKAIDAYQTFINTYPTSSRIAKCNEQIDKLREKLEKKALKAAELYYKTQNYRAAAITYQNLLLDYPDIDNNQDIQYKIVKSYFEYAEQSIPTKQSERYNESIKAANNYLNRYAAEAFAPEIKKIKEEAHYNVIKSQYNAAMSSLYEKRIDLLNAIPEEYQVQKTFVQNEKFKKSLDSYLEKSYFQVIKTEYTLAQESKPEDKARHYKAAIEAYNVFASNYTTSKYLREAQRVLSASEKNYKKYTNG